MCGIVGIASGTPVSSRDWLIAGRDAMQHRGPDDAGDWWSPDGCVGLGHRRLAILDLSPAGHQPMHDAAEDLAIVFNGEIFNFADLRDELRARGRRFRTASDTEVILAAYQEWGTDCVTRLNGQFAFAVYDRRRRQLFLARDRAGEKPLFYAVADGTLRFGSELKSLMADPSWPRRIDPAGLDCFLAMGFVPGDGCILGGVSKLPPAHALLWDQSSWQVRVWRYWELPRPAAGDGAVRDEAGLVAQLETLLEDAVRRQLVADVPVGVLLSGGVDSSLVTAMAARVRPAVKTFTVAFAGHAAYDESAHARLIARHFGTDHVELQANDATVELLPVLARQFDEPLIDSSMIPTYLVSRLVREHCTVVLGGDGGDELFGGYFHHSRLLWMHQQLRFLPGSVRQAVAASAGVLPIGFKGKNWLQALGADARSGLPHIATYFDARARRRLLGGSHDARVADAIRMSRIPADANLLERVTRMDFENFLPEDILVKVDRASMLNSLEVRAPLLDRRIIEFAFGTVPAPLKATPSARKILLKGLAAKILPPEFDRQRKQGFSIPLASWLSSGPWHSYFRDVLLSSSQTLFSHQVINGLLAGQAKGRANGERLFGLMMFELWRREYRL